MRYCSPFSGLRLVIDFLGHGYFIWEAVGGDMKFIQRSAVHFCEQATISTFFHP